MFRSCCLLLLAVPLASAQSDAAAFAHAIELHRAGDLAGAAQAYQSVIAADPSRFEARSNLGSIYSQQGRYADAIEQYREALKTAPEAAADHLRLNLGLAYYKSAQLPAAAEIFTTLHDRNATDTQTTLLLADCELQLGEYAKVIALLKPIEAQQPDQRAITYLLGMALIRDGQVAEGQRRIDLLLKGGDSVEGQFMVGTAMFMAHDYPGALKAFARVVEATPAIPSAQSYYGRALLATGDADRASEAFRKELETNPNDFDANRGLGEILQHRGQLEQAKPYLERAALLRPGFTAKAEPTAAQDDPGLSAGTPAPDFPSLGLVRYRGHKPVVLVFGSFTCPQFRSSSAALTELSKKYGSKVAFLLVYIREAHTGSDWKSTINEREGVDLPPARDLAEKQQHAQFCVRKLSIPYASVVDGMNEEAEKAYAAWPSRVYVVGRDGRVAFNTRLGELHFQQQELETAIQRALSK